MNTLTTELSTLAEIEADFNSITEKDMKRALRRLDAVEENDACLGTLFSESTRKLWTLVDRYSYIEGKKLEAALNEADTEEEMSDLKIKAQRALFKKDLVLKMFWLQVHDDIGEGAWNADSLSIRADWMIVSKKSTNDFMDSIKKMFGG